MQNRSDISPAKPLTLADHVKSYGELMLEELTESKNLWRKRTLLQVMGAGGLGVSASLAGMATMLWAVTPLPQIHSLWLLFAVPLVFFLLGVTCLVVANQQKQAVVFEHTRQRLMADMARFKATNLAAAATEHFVLPLAKAHPYRLVLGAAMVGALAVRAHPWRWLSGSAVLVGLLPKLISALSQTNKTPP